MMHDKVVRRRRAVLAVLVLLSLFLLTAYFGEGNGGALHGVQRGAVAFAEVRGQKEQREEHQYGEDRTAPAHDFVMHHRLGGRRLLLRLRFERWIASNSSSERPEPTATHVSGDSARCAGI